MKRGTICTVSGVEFDILNPVPDMVRLADIVVGLSNMKRFNGQSFNPVDVARHSSIVAALLRHWGADPWTQIGGLFHDASESYLLDLAKPVKDIPEFQPYRDAEERITLAIEEKIFPPGVHEIVDWAAVKEADHRAFLLDRHLTMPQVDWWKLRPPYSDDFEAPRIEYLYRDLHDFMKSRAEFILSLEIICSDLPEATSLRDMILVDKSFSLRPLS